MGLMDVLQQYVNPNAGPPRSDVDSHYEEVARAAPPAIVGQGLGDAFRADATPSFGEMVGTMFGRSNPQQQAGVLNQLVASIGPSVLAALGIGSAAASVAGTSTPPQITPQQASQLSPSQVQTIAA